jgi:hypothetical protein
MQHIHYELPKDIVRRLEQLLFVIGLDDLETTNAEAIKWFNELACNSS